MKISETTNGMLTISLNAAQDGERGKRADGSKQNTTIFIGDLQKENEESAIEKKRKEIREKAAKVLLDKFDSDLERDERMEESRVKIDEAQEDRKEAQSRIKEMEEWLENAPEEARSDEATMQTYREGLKQAYMEKAEAESTILSENANIRSEKKAKLGESYEQSMSYAADQAEKIEKAGASEITGMMMQEAMNHIDEIYQENIEKAQEEKEKKEEEEEKLEALRENREEIEQQVESAKEQSLETQAAAVRQTDAAPETNVAVQKTADLDKELQKLQQEAEQMDEALKGLLVDVQM